jgi:TrmH family RNA methyltransferase
MLSKNVIKIINSLRIKKFRNEAGLFIAEGDRLVEELLASSIRIKAIYHTSAWGSMKTSDFETITVSTDDMKKISGLASPSNVLALVYIPEFDLSLPELTQSLTIALDEIQDPGNLGTIIRLANWFGIETIICSTDTVDAFSPKVIQSCMGAISKVKVIYCNLPEVIYNLKNKHNLPIYGTFMEGTNIYSEKLSSTGLIVMGNEGNGISPQIERLVTHKIHIPSFASNPATVESLNVAMAAAIVCSEFRRRK